MRKLECHHNLPAQFRKEKAQLVEYNGVLGIIIARTMFHLNQITESGICFGQQHLLQKGLKVFGEKGYEASLSELKQQHDRVCFRPV